MTTLLRSIFGIAQLDPLAWQIQNTKVWVLLVEAEVKKTACFAICGLVVALAACVPPRADVQLNVNTSEYAVYKVPGTASIAGQAFLRQRGGGVVTCAGSQVFLLPDTSAFRNLVQTASTSQVNLKTEGNIQSVGRMTMCDAQGNFRFDNLPVASWIVGTQVRWEVGSAGQGGDLLTRVSTSSGGTTQVLLSDANRL